MLCVYERWDVQSGAKMIGNSVRTQKKSGANMVRTWCEHCSPQGKLVRTWCERRVRITLGAHMFRTWRYLWASLSELLRTVWTHVDILLVWQQKKSCSFLQRFVSYGIYLTKKQQHKFLMWRGKTRTFSLRHDAVPLLISRGMFRTECRPATEENRDWYERVAIHQRQKSAW